MHADKFTSCNLRWANDLEFFRLELFSQLYGKLIHSLSNILTDTSAWNMALKTFRQMALCNSTTVRKWCAYNLPLVLNSINQPQSHKLTGVVFSLADYDSLETREMLASCFHDISENVFKGILRSETIRAVGRLLADV